MIIKITPKLIKISVQNFLYNIFYRNLCYSLQYKYFIISSYIKMQILINRNFIRKVANNDLEFFVFKKNYKFIKILN